MMAWHVIKVFLAAILAGFAGWIAMAAFTLLFVLRNFEAFEATGSDASANRLSGAFGQALGNMHAGSAVFLGVALACVPLSEIFGMRSLMFYAGAAGALTLGLASAFSPPIAEASGAAAALAGAGFVAGAVYWLLAGRSAA